MQRVTKCGCLCAMLFLGGLATPYAQQVTITGHITLVDRVAPGRAENNANVVVWLTPISGPATPLGGFLAQPPPPRLRLLQKHKRFEPHVVVLPLGSVVEFPNTDLFFHNVFSLFEGKRFDLGLYEAGATRAVHFDRAGVCYIFCNIHPEMSAVVVVLKTPFYAVSDRSGELSIPNVPPGRYRVQVWHERSLPEVLKSLTREVTVSENFRSLGTIRLSEARNLRLEHKNKYGRDYDSPTPSNPLYEQP